MTIAGFGHLGAVWHTTMNGLLKPWDTSTFLAAETRPRWLGVTPR